MYPHMNVYDYACTVVGPLARVFAVFFIFASIKTNTFPWIGGISINSLTISLCYICTTTTDSFVRPVMEQPWWLCMLCMQRLISDPGYLQIWSMVQHQQGNRSMAMPRETHHQKTAVLSQRPWRLGRFGTGQKPPWGFQVFGSCLE